MHMPTIITARGSSKAYNLIWKRVSCSVKSRQQRLWLVPRPKRLKTSLFTKDNSQRGPIYVVSTQFLCSLQVPFRKLNCRHTDWATKIRSQGKRVARICQHGELYSQPNSRMVHLLTPLPNGNHRRR